MLGHDVVVKISGDATLFKYLATHASSLMLVTFCCPYFSPSCLCLRNAFILCSDEKYICSITVPHASVSHFGGMCCTFFHATFILKHNL